MRRFSPRRVPLLTRSTAEAILAAMARGEGSIRISLDLWMGQEDVELREGRAVIRGVELYREELGLAAGRSSEADVLLAVPGLPKAQFFRSGSFYKLRNVEGAAPTLEINGIHMHRIEGVTPWEDAGSKVRAAGIGRGSYVLDTATGLGYTAIRAVERGASVLTVERDQNVLEMAELNPWSSALSSPGVELEVGDFSELARDLPEGAFTHVVHDPPRYSMSPGMYSAELYSRIMRLLRPGGVLLHYVGEPGRARGRRLSSSTAARLKSVGFEGVRYLPEIMCLVARVPR